MRALASAALCLVALLRPAAADEPDDPVALARRHFQRGRQFYEHGDYARSLREFSAGYEIAPRPEFLFRRFKLQREEIARPALQLLHLHADPFGTETHRAAGRIRLVLERQLRDLAERVARRAGRRARRDAEARHLLAVPSRAVDCRAQVGVRMAASNRSGRQPPTACSGRWGPTLPPADGRPTRHPWAVEDVGLAAIA
jgi:hypothetical protein